MGCQFSLSPRCARCVNDCGRAAVGTRIDIQHSRLERSLILLVRTSHLTCDTFSREPGPAYLSGLQLRGEGLSDISSIIRHVQFNWRHVGIDKKSKAVCRKRSLKVGR